jgi:hypothetical protein
LQKLLSYPFQQNIWRVLPHPAPGVQQWAIELREINQKKVSFALIDVHEQEPRWVTKPEDADWWTSMTGFSENHILVHHYRYPEIPQPTDLSALSTVDGQLTWTLPNYVLVRTINRNTLEVASTRDNGLKHVLYDLENGRMNDLTDQNPTPSSIILRQTVRYKSGDIYFDKLSTYLSENFNINNATTIDYLDHRPYLVFSYYLYECEKIAQYLLILTDKKELVLHEKLSEGRSGIGQSTLMLKESVLVYLMGNTEFRSLKLSQ